MPNGQRFPTARRGGDSSSSRPAQGPLSLPNSTAALESINLGGLAAPLQLFHCSHLEWQHCSTAAPLNPKFQEPGGEAQGEALLHSAFAANWNRGTAPLQPPSQRPGGTAHLQHQLPASTGGGVLLCCSSPIEATWHGGTAFQQPLITSSLEGRLCLTAAPTPSHSNGLRCSTAALPLHPHGMVALLLSSPHYQQPGWKTLPSCSSHSQPPLWEALLHCSSPIASTWNGGTASPSQQTPSAPTWRGGTAQLQLLLPATTKRGTAPLQLPHCSHLGWRHCFQQPPFPLRRRCPAAASTPSHHKGRRCSTTALLL